MVLGRIRGVLLCFALAWLIAPATAGALNQVSFSQVGNLTTPRDAPGVGLLPDGRVLVAGGYNTASLDTAEIFDPKTNTFSSVAARMSSVRYAPAAASLPDGRVLIAGGYKGPGDLASAEVFNPATGTFSPVGPMLQPLELARAAPLPDGRILIVAGSSNGIQVNTTEIFDPKTNAFSAGPTLPESVYGPGVAVISGGRILIAGGNGSSGDVDAAFAFEPSSGAFSSVGSLPDRLRSPASDSLPQGRALVAGGRDQLGEYLTSAFMFDPTTNSFSSAGIGSLNHKREEAAAAELADGRVLVVGGWDGGPVNTAEVLSVPSNAFKAKLRGRKVKFSVTNEGVAEVTDVSTELATTAKKKKPKLVKTTSKHGGPGKIIVKVKLTKLGSRTLGKKGKLRIRVAYTPDQGLASTRKLRLRAGK